jgi:hypothetical protein
MLPRRIPLLGLAALALLPLRASATTVEAPEFRELVDTADFVVRGVVVAVDSEWREHEQRRYIATSVEIAVHEVLRGSPPQPLVLEILGGRVGDDELVVEGAPRFLVGEENIFFVRGNGRTIFPLVGIMHGLYPILHDFTSGHDYVLRSNGMPLYSEQDVSLPMTRLSSVKVKNPAAPMLTAGAFSRLVRHAPVRATLPAVEN